MANHNNPHGLFRRTVWLKGQKNVRSSITFKFHSTENVPVIYEDLYKNCASRGFIISTPHLVSLDKVDQRSDKLHIQYSRGTEVLVNGILITKLEGETNAGANVMF
jgi:hypothetical protein